MHFLIAAKRMPGGIKPIGGVQSWSTTVATELKARGHRVTFWGPEAPLPFMPDSDQHFDAGIIANWKHTHDAANLCKRIINISHGIIGDEEPHRELADAGRVLFTSEGVKKHWGMPGMVLRQPIDTRFWSPLDEHRAAQFPPRGALMRYGRSKGLNFLPDLARKMGMHYFHASHLTHVQARDEMRRATCVLASGRAAVEAMSVGVPVLVCDHRAKYQDALMSMNPEGQMFENYSGRGGVPANMRTVDDGIRRAIARGSLREHVLRHHNVAKVVDDLLFLSL